MTRLPVVSGREAVRAFERAGWELLPRHRGSHMILRKAGLPFGLSIPDHKELGRGTLKRLISQAGLTVREFVALLD